jgi:hypothetical protein
MTRGNPTLCTLAAFLATGCGMTPPEPTREPASESATVRFVVPCLESPEDKDCKTRSSDACNGRPYDIEVDGLRFTPNGTMKQWTVQCKSVPPALAERSPALHRTPPVCEC